MVVDIKVNNGIFNNNNNNNNNNKKKKRKKEKKRKVNNGDYWDSIIELKKFGRNQSGQLITWRST
jgi:hypothetical protein